MKKLIILLVFFCALFVCDTMAGNMGMDMGMDMGTGGDGPAGRGLVIEKEYLKINGEFLTID